MKALWRLALEHNIMSKRNADKDSIQQFLRCNRWVVLYLLCVWRDRQRSQLRSILPRSTWFSRPAAVWCLQTNQRRFRFIWGQEADLPAYYSVSSIFPPQSKTDLNLSRPIRRNFRSRVTRKVCINPKSPSRN